MKIFRSFLWIFFALIIAVAVGIFFIYLSAPKRYNFLVIGSDQRGEERARSDVLMLLSIPKSSQEPVSVITIPRDTLIRHPEYGMQKITHFYAFGERTESEVFGNTELTVSVVEDLLNIHVHGTFEVTFEGFKNIVDYLGGVDTTAGHLNGEEALEIVRDRYREGGDFARTEDQREVFLSLVSKVTGYQRFRHTYAYIQIQPFSRIRWSKQQVGRFIVGFVLGQGFHFDFGEAREAVLPGAGASVYTPEFGKELYYWVLDEAALETLKQEFLQGGI